MSRYKRPMPDDFAHVATTMSVKRLRKHYAVGSTTVYNWLASIGRYCKSNGQAMPPPDDFRAQAAKLYPEQLKRHYGRSSNTISRWLDECGIVPVNGFTMPRRDAPADFTALAPTMTKTALKDHYRADIRTIGRWYAETGADRLIVKPAPPTGRRRGAYNMTPSLSRAGGNLSITRILTIHDQAADTLRRERWAVYRCTEKGKADFKGAFWRVGNVVCAPDELLERAARAERRAV